MPINLANIARNSAKGAGANIVKNVGDIIKSDRGEGSLRKVNVKYERSDTFDKDVYRYPIDLGSNWNKYAILFNISEQDNGEIKESETNSDVNNETQKEKGAVEQPDDTTTPEIDNNIKTISENDEKIKKIETKYKEYRVLADFGETEKRQLKSGTTLSKTTKQYFASKRRVGNKQSGELKQETIDKVAEFSRQYNKLLEENKTLLAKNENLSKQKKAPTPPPADGTTQSAAETYETKSISLRRNATFHLKKSIALYFPAKITNNTSVQYGSIDVSSYKTAAGGAVLSEVNNLFGGEGLSVSGLKSIGAAIEAGAQNEIMEMLPGLRETGEIISGRGIRADRTEVSFKSIDKRSFNFDFKFMPKSAEESREVEQIVKTFRKYQLPKLSTKVLNEVKNKKNNDKGNIGFQDTNQVENGAPKVSTSKLFFDSPGYFDIQFMVNAQENPHLIKMSRSFLKSVNVTYGSDRAVFFKGSNGAPTEITMQLQFQEIEMLYRGRIEDGL